MFKSQTPNECTNGDTADASNDDANHRRCESEQSFILKAQYSRARNKPYILNIKRIKEKQIPENSIIMSEANQLPISPACDFFDSSDRQNARTHRYVLTCIIF